MLRVPDSSVSHLTQHWYIEAMCRAAPGEYSARSLVFDSHMLDGAHKKESTQLSDLGLCRSPCSPYMESERKFASRGYTSNTVPHPVGNEQKLSIGCHSTIRAIVVKRVAC